MGIRFEMDKERRLIDIYIIDDDKGNESFEVLTYKEFIVFFGKIMKKIVGGK